MPIYTTTTSMIGLEQHLNAGRPDLPMMNFMTWDRLMNQAQIPTFRMKPWKMPKKDIKRIATCGC